MNKLTLNDIQENIAIIKINKSYHDDMSALELYDVTRGCWKRSIESVSVAEYVLAVSFGEVKEVYKVDSWVPASELHRETIPFDADIEKGRIGFHGKVAPEDIRQKYIFKSVVGLFKHGEANPVKVFLAETATENYSEDINTALASKAILEDGLLLCPRCDSKFKIAERCPNCGQLVFISD